MAWMRGLVPGGVAAILASLVSLALDSPDGAVFNPAVVALGALVVGLAAGVVWGVLKDRPYARPAFVGAVLAGFALAALGAVIIEAQLEGTVRYALPLDSLVFAVVGVLTPFVSGLELPGMAGFVAPLVSLVAALGLGVGLLAVDDGEGGRLELPDVTSTPDTGEVIAPDDVAGVTYVVVPGESTLTYTVREKSALLPASNDAVGRTTDLSGTVRLDGEPSELSADMSTLQSDQSLRDSYVQTNIFQIDPIVTFVVDDLSGLPDSYTPGETITQTVTGTATVRGVERPLAFEVEARIDGGTLQIVGRTDFTWADFEITPPNTQFITVEDNVHIEVLLIARPVAGDPGA